MGQSVSRSKCQYCGENHSFLMVCDSNPNAGSPADVDVLQEQPQSGRLYLMLFVLEGKHIIKCGKSSGSSSDSRLLSIFKDYGKVYRKYPECELLRDVACDDVFSKESEFHAYFQEHRFYPSKKFDGYTELFDIPLISAYEKFDELIGRSIKRPNNKECYTCKKVLPTFQFHTNRAKKDGLHNECKLCTKLRQRSIKSLYSRMYSNQVEHSRYRSHPRPSYTSEDLKVWLDAQPNYKSLYEDYKNSGYSKALVPSVDRIDPNAPYTLDNIRLMTWQENMDLNINEMRSSNAKPVLKVCTKTGEVLGSYKSLVDASEATGVCAKGISRCVANGINKYGRLYRAGGFHWVLGSDKYLYMEDGKILSRLM